MTPPVTKELATPVTVATAAGLDRKSTPELPGRIVMIHYVVQDVPRHPLNDSDTDPLSLQHET